LPEAVRELERVENPLNLTVAMSLKSIVSQQHLVAENGGQQLCPVVVEPAVPSVLVKVEACLQPIVERFYSLASSTE
jgi:hypothetical protein